MFCPNINSKEYKYLASIVGGEAAHSAWNANGGLPMEFNPDGSSSQLLTALIEEYGERKAIAMKVAMLSEDFIKRAGPIFSDRGESHLNEGKVNGFTVVPHQYFNKKTKLVDKFQDCVLVERKVDMLISNIEKSFPGLHIIRENTTTIKDKYSAMMMEYPGFVAKDGVHFNMDYIHPAMPIHEMTHLIVTILEKAEPQVFAQLMQKTKDYLKENDAIEKHLRRKHPNWSEYAILNEAIAMIAGDVSEGRVKEYITDEKDIPGFLESIKHIADSFWTAITNFLRKRYGGTVFDGDIRDKTINDILESFTNDLMAGRHIYSFNDAERDILMKRLSGDQTNNFEEEVGRVTTISSVMDIPNILINNPDGNAVKNDATNLASNPNKFATMVFRKAYTMDNGKNYHIQWLGKHFVYSGSLGTEGINEKIINEILPYHRQASEAFGSNISKVMKNIKDGMEVEKSIETVFMAGKEKDDSSRSYMSMNQIQKLIEFIGGNDNIVDVLPLSELAIMYPSMSGLIDKSLVGFDPIVVIHSMGDKNIELSISDITAGDLGRSSTLTGENLKLTGRFMMDYESSNKIIWTNDKKDSRAAALTMTLAGMNHFAKKNGIKMKVRRTGVYGMRGGLTGSVIGRTIHNLTEAFDMVHEVMNLPGMGSLIDNEVLREVIADEDAWKSKDMGVSHLFELQSYYHSDNISDEINDRYRKSLLGENLSRNEHIKVLRRRQKRIEKKDTNFQNDYEYMMISKAILFYNRGWNVNNMNIDDLSSVTKNLINIHNVGHPMMQYASIEFERAKSMVVNYMNEFTFTFTNLIKESKKSHGIFGTNSEKLFQHLFPTTTVIADKDYKNHKAGDIVEIHLYNQIYCSTHRDTARLLKEGKLKKADVELADFIVANVKEKFIQNIQYKNRFNDKYTRDMAEKEFEGEYTEGTIPVIPATQSQSLRSGNYKNFTRRFLNDISNGDIQWGALMDGEFSGLHSRFLKQVSFESQLHQMGLEMHGDKYSVFDLNAVMDQSDNLEYTIKSFLLDMERTQVYDEYVLPIYNDCLAITNYVDRTIGTSQDNVKIFMKDYYNLVAMHKHKDQTDGDKMTKTVAPIVRSVLALNSFVSLAYRPLIWIKSAYFNEQSAYISGLANTISNIGVRDENKIDMPGVKEVTQAHDMLFNDYKKVMALAHKMQLVNNSERDVIESVFTNISDRNLIKEQLAQIGNIYTDYAARAMSMVSYMLKDGSYDAHQYDEKTNTFTYDVKKDKRFYANETDANPIEGWDKVHERIMDRQGDQGLLKDGQQAIGYDFEEINKRFKYYSDKYIIGSMDPIHRAMLGNTFAGASLTQFRGFSFDKIWNAIALNKISTEYGGRLVPVKDENGEWITVETQQEMEGVLRSIVGSIYDLRKAESWSAEKWQTMNPIRRKNLATSFVKAVVLLLIYSAIKAADLSDRDERKLTWMFSDIFIFNTIQNIYDNPIPAITSIKDITAIAMGEKKLHKILRFTGPLNDVNWLYELASDNDDIGRLIETDKQKAKDKAERKAKSQAKKLKEMEDAVDDMA